MAKINYQVRGGGQEQDSSFVSLASLGVMLCMIVSLVGIKIWWFKHRLTFDQSSTRNGAAGGSQPAVVQRRSRNSKDKRLSQQIREPVNVHGVFRKRNEDELDIVQSNQLPPVRIRKLSQSTPSLFFPPSPRRRNEAQSAAFEDFQPPAREPPKPPVESLPTTPIQEIILPPFEEFAQQFQKVEMNRVEELEIIEESGNERAIFETPQAPKRLNRGAQDSGHKFLRAKAAAEPENQKFAERRATGYLRPSDEDLQAMQQLEIDDDRTETSVEEFGERRPTGYIKYAEIDVEGLDDFRHKWETLELDKNFEASNETRLFEVDNIMSVKERRPTGYVRSIEQMWENAELETDKTADERWLEIENPQRKKILEIKDNKDDAVEGSKDYIFSADRPSSVIEKEEHSLKDYAFKSYTDNDNEPPQRSVKFLVEDEDKDNEDDTFKMVRRPTGYVRSSDKLWEDEDQNESSTISKKDHHLWLEMERDVEEDFTNTVEEEFNKIRHSYEANEGDFLEIRDELEKFDRAMMKPKGFGKSIDEDWENFEHFQNAKENLNEVKINQEETIDFGENENHTVKFKLTGLEHTEEKESSLRTERRATGYVRNIEELYKDLDIEDDFGYEESKVKFTLEEDLGEIKTESSALRERRPTGYVKRDHIFEPDEEEEKDNTVELQFKTNEDFEPEVIRKPKPRQKVTFDFHTEEYYVPANAESDSEEDLSFIPPTVPKPMQRMTKMQYTEEPVKTEPPTAILFGTQVSFEDPATPNSNDSWSAIRQHRYLTEEFHQLPLSQTEIVVTPAPREPPKPAYRNPLAQMAASQRNETPIKTEIEVVEEEEVFIKPRTMRDMKKAQSRQYSNQLSFDDYAATTTSTTEA